MISTVIAECHLRSNGGAKMKGTAFSSRVFHTLSRQWYPAVQWDPPWLAFGWHVDYPGGLYPSHANFSPQSRQDEWNYVGPYPTPESIPILFSDIIITGTTCTLRVGDFGNSTGTWTRTGRVPWGVYALTSSVGAHAGDFPASISVNRIAGAYPWKPVPWA